MNDTSRRNSWRKAIVPVAVLVASAVIALLVLSNRAEPERRREVPEAPLVRVVTAQRSDVALAVRSYGEVEPAVETTLIAEVAGRLAWVSESLRPGGRFAAGDVLARLDDADFRLALDQAEAGRARARVQLEVEEAEAAVAIAEWEELGSGEPSALTRREPQLQRARAELQAAEAALEQARLDLSRTAVRAPFAGSTRTQLADVGRYVSRGTALAEVFSTREPELALPVSREDLRFLDLTGVDGGSGPRVRATAEIGGATGAWTGRIVRTAGALDPSTRMLPLYARLDAGGSADAPTMLPMGLFVEAEIEGITAEDVVALPRAALRSEGRIFVVDGEDRLRFRDVELLRAEAERVLVAGGLEEGERVCVSPLETVVDGMAVRVAADGVGESRE